MTAKKVPTRLAFSLVLVAVMASWAMGETRQANSTPVWYRIWTPNLYGLNMYHYLGPIAPYAPGFYPLDGWYYPPLFAPPRYSPLLPGSFPAPGYVPYAYPPPYYGGYYPLNTYQWWYYRWYNQPWDGPRRHNYRGIRDGRPNPQAPTEVPRSQ